MASDTRSLGLPHSVSIQIRLEIICTPSRYSGRYFVRRSRRRGCGAGASVPEDVPVARHSPRRVHARFPVRPPRARAGRLAPAPTCVVVRARAADRGRARADAAELWHGRARRPLPVPAERVLCKAAGTCIYPWPVIFIYTVSPGHDPKCVQTHLHLLALYRRDRARAGTSAFAPVSLV
jgi:hypothetical protein